MDYPPLEKTEIKDRGSNRHQPLTKADHTPVKDAIAEKEQQILSFQQTARASLAEFDSQTKELVEQLVADRNNEREQIVSNNDNQLSALKDECKEKKEHLAMAVRDDLVQATEYAKQVATELKYNRVVYQGEDGANWNFMFTDLNREALRPEVVETPAEPTQDNPLPRPE